MEQMNKEIAEKVIKRTLQQIKLKHGQLAISLYSSHTHPSAPPAGAAVAGKDSTTAYCPEMAKSLVSGLSIGVAKALVPVCHLEPCGSEKGSPLREPNYQETEAPLWPREPEVFVEVQDHEHGAYLRTK
ncbi:Slc47a1 [Symbiodinium necroappetens]|uniref:Slc47a1 protein n=1 Tax=Symbiodinium necroappetens TaxID=1628268 RepID=A0A812UNX9_9DINO|nr:Slc47a1 [Symbiodinium necroappetens]